MISAVDRRHSHDSSADGPESKSPQAVLLLTLAAMGIEIAAGMLYGSMALLADGWHMATHAAAFVIVLATHHYARKHRNDPAFSFGTGKFSALGGFASAAALAVVALTMLAESAQRLIRPPEVRFDEAIGVAVFGLLVNLVSAALLKEPEGHGDHHHDHSLRAAYVHVLADTLTSVLAIAALLAGKWLGWMRLDAAAGLIGGAVIARWAFGLLRETSPVLLDGTADGELRRLVRERIEAVGGAEVTDLHLWQIGPSNYAVVIALITDAPCSPDEYKAKLADFRTLSHVTVEVNGPAPGVR